MVFDCWIFFHVRLCWQTDDSWSESTVDNEEDWLVRELSAVLAVEHRKVCVDPNLSDAELLQLIDDELYRHQHPDVDIQTRPNEYVADYFRRLRRFSTNVDYFIDAAQTRASK